MHGASRLYSAITTFIKSNKERYGTIMDNSIMRNALVPMVIEQTGRGERSYDIFSRLLNDHGNKRVSNNRVVHIYYLVSKYYVKDRIQTL